MTVEEAIKLAPLASALVAGVAAIVAAASATFAGVQMRLARRTAVIQVLQAFDKAATEREAALASASDIAQQEHAFHEFMNFLELYAAICNRGLLSSPALDLVRDRLTDSVVVIERIDQWHTVIDQAVFHTATFAELRTFLEANRTRLDDRRRAAAERARQIANHESVG